MTKMNKTYTALLLMLATLLTCCTDEQSGPQAEGTLILSDISCKDVPRTVVKTRNAIDSDLAIEILASDGNVYRGYQYGAGEALPDKFSLIPASYTLHAYSENAETWESSNGGLGSAIYEVREPFSVQEDWVTYLNVQVPMVNYGVTYSVPALFSSWFPTCEFTVSGGGRTCPITASQTAYFDPASGNGFRFTLHLVNSDGETYDLETQSYENPKAGLIYNVTYSFASDDDPTKLNIGISYDDTYEEIVKEVTLY